MPLPLDLPLVDEMLEPLTIDDWLILMENYALRALKLSADPAHQALYRDLRDALLPFGITLSERGIRHGRSPGDLVLALSEAKDQATVDILRAESEALDEKLRAVVLTDYERLSARTRRLKGVLDPDAGSAVRVFRLLVADPTTQLLSPVLVTGKVVLVSARSRRPLEGAIRRWVEEHRADFSWEWRATESEQVLQLAGSGRDWSSRTYVALLTDLFERGVTQCLVGTRGLFGEGWDALRLNTLIDLTSVTTKHRRAADPRPHHPPRSGLAAQSGPQLGRGLRQPRLRQGRLRPAPLHRPPRPHLGHRCPEWARAGHRAGMERRKLRPALAR